MLRRIEKEIERVALMEGVYFPGDESVTINMILNDEQKADFLNLNLDDRYYWEFDGNKLFLTYTDEG